MSLIKNLIKEPEQKPFKSKNAKETAIDAEAEEKKPRPVVKSATDLQRLKLEKLMKNPDKPVMIPEARKEKDYLQTVPSFVRNVMGSSAGAGSGEFHVYRHLRRKEYARQKTIQAKSAREQLDDDYQQKLEDNRLAADEKTAKKRAKRLKKKQRSKRPRETKQGKSTEEVIENDEETSDDEEKSGNEDSEQNQQTADNCEESTLNEQTHANVIINENKATLNQSQDNTIVAVETDMIVAIDKSTQNNEEQSTEHIVTTPNQVDAVNEKSEAEK